MKRSPIKRRKPLSNGRSVSSGVVARRAHPFAPSIYKPRAEDDKVTPELRQFILARDGRCMAPVLDKELMSLCGDQYGNAIDNGTYFALTKMHIDHVPAAGESGMGMRARSDKEHLIVICPKHHLFGWATSKRGRSLERDYLNSLYPSQPHV